MSATPALSVMFFASDATAPGGDRYALVRDASVLADDLGYQAVWLPERHFDPFGGLFPNPSVLAAAVAALTRRCHIRAGSVVAPLHDPLRIVEEWSIVDNLAGPGRVGLSIGSGWNTNDFVLAPDRYESRVERSRAAVDELRVLWSGGRVERVNGSGRTVSVVTQPRPASSELPLWLTASGNPETFAAAGRLGTNVLTHLLGHGFDELSGKIGIYRDARAAAGHDPATGQVTLMLHAALVEGDPVGVAGYPPLRDYLRSALQLEMRASSGGGAVSGGRRVALPDLPEALIDELIDERARRFCTEASLIGSVSDCRRMLARVAAAGVDEVACLVDFGPPATEVSGTLRGLADIMAGVGSAAR